MSRFDSVVLGGSLVLPGAGVTRADVGIRDGVIAAISQGLTARDGNEVVDARDRVVLPGGVDAHYHLGIYRSFAEDTRSETRSSLVGGATTVLSYFRTGQHYLERTGPYRELLPEVIDAVSPHAHTDFGFHVAPMDQRHIEEIPWLVHEAGVASFKYFMFYKGLNLHANSTDTASFTMSDNYDFGHLLAIMEEIARVDAESPGRISLSLHCENAELIKHFIAKLEGREVPPLQAYHEARPPLSERISIHEAGVLASATRVRLNLLHLSSTEALRAAAEIRHLYPELDIRQETTLHHLCLNYPELDARPDRLGGKVNPPIRTTADNDALWSAVAGGQITWVASDHACCLEEHKGEDIWKAYAGFGGTALLYPVLISEGYHRRGLSLERVAELASTAPARSYGAAPRKGSISVGADADLVLVDLEREQVVTPDLLLSDQEYTPFAGMAVKGWPTATILRGRLVYRDGEVVGEPTGRFLARSGAAG
jgi:dihydropyrimidinase/allantoinase